MIVGTDLTAFLLHAMIRSTIVEESSTMLRDSSDQAVDALASPPPPAPPASLSSLPPQSHLSAPRRTALTLFKDIGNSHSPYHTGVMMMTRKHSAALLSQWKTAILSGNHRVDQKAIVDAVEVKKKNESWDFFFIFFF